MNLSNEASSPGAAQDALGILPSLGDRSVSPEVSLASDRRCCPCTPAAG